MTQLLQKISFQCPIKIDAASSEDDIPSFSMLAYTGGKMKIEGFQYPVVVDLAGMAIKKQTIPVRLDHDRRQGVGHTNSVVIENGSVVAVGVISRNTVAAKDVAKSGTQGFPWQASIGADVLDAEFIPNGNTVQVNGRTFDGPIYVVRKSNLKEISFVDNGADSNTVVKVAACEGQEENPNIQAAQIPQEDPVINMRKKIADETRRIEAIRNICGSEFPEIEAKAIEAGWDATACELEVLRASRPKAPAAKITKPVTEPAVFEAVAMMASGIQSGRLEAIYDSRTLEAADKLRGIGIQEFCEQAVGMQLPRFRRDATGWLQATFSTASLPGILSNVANKMLLEGYNYIEDSWRKICKIASVNDFKEHERYRMTGAFTFEKVGPDGELKHGKITEQKYGQKADTHGIMFALTRQMIINDDLGAFTEIPRQIGMGAAESIADALWQLLLSNPGNFFSSANKNYLAGADTNLCIDSLTKAEVLFSEQTKPNGRPLGLPPAILLVPTALKVPAQLIMSSASLNETTTADKAKPKDNPHVGKFEVVSTSYLSNSSFAGYSSKAWYLFADPNRMPAIEVAFLNGVDKPTVEKTDADYNTLGILFRGYIDFGVREQETRAAVKMKGEA